MTDEEAFERGFVAGWQAREAERNKAQQAAQQVQASRCSVCNLRSVVSCGLPNCPSWQGAPIGMTRVGL